MNRTTRSRPPSPIALSVVLLQTLLLASACGPGRDAPTEASTTASGGYDIVIANGRVIDPDSGLDEIRHVGIRGRTIAAISETPLQGGATIDASGLVVAPGFIDSHVNRPDLASNRARAMDGVTTIFVTESAPLDIDGWYEEMTSSAVVHYGSAVGFWEARLEVVGDPALEGEARWIDMEHTKATPQQLQQVLARLEAGLEKGAVGIGIPLEYVPAATQAEILEVFRLAARHGAPAHIHMRGWGYDEKRVRSYGDLYEVVSGSILSGADVRVLHLDSSYNDWTPIGLELLGKAQQTGVRVSADVTAYTYGGCPSSAAYFDDWESYPDEYFSTKLQLASTGEWLTRERFRAIRESPTEVPLLCHDNSEEMLTLALASPLTTIGSDGGGTPHPRIAGTFSRVLGHYVRERKVLSLMDALAKMTVLQARHFEKRVPAMQRKGRLQVDADADIVVFDPQRIEDRSTVEDPLAFSVGVRHLLVVGNQVVVDGELRDGVLAGEPLRGRRRE